MPVGVDLTAEGQNIVRICAELYVVSTVPNLKFSVLVRAMKGPRKDVAALRKLNLLQRTSRLINVVSIDGPISREVGCRCADT